MDCVLQEQDVVMIENRGQFLLVKSLEYRGQVYHYMIKLKENQENPEIIFAKEDILTNGELDLKAVTNRELIAELLMLMKNKR